MDDMVEIRAKLKALWDIHEKLKPGFEQNFVRDNLQRNFYSVRVIECIEKLFRVYIKGSPDSERENNNTVVKCGRVAAYKSAAGWQVYIDMKAIGCTITKRDAEIIVPWLGRDVEGLEEVLMKAKPVIQAQHTGG